MHTVIMLHLVIDKGEISDQSECSCVDRNDFNTRGYVRLS